MPFKHGLLSSYWRLYETWRLHDGPIGHERRRNSCQVSKRLSRARSRGLRRAYALQTLFTAAVLTIHRRLARYGSIGTPQRHPRHHLHLALL